MCRLGRHPQGHPSALERSRETGSRPTCSPSVPQQGERKPLHHAVPTCGEARCSFHFRSMKARVRSAATDKRPSKNTMEELVSTTIEPGQNRDDYFNHEHVLRHRADELGETMSDRWYKDICVTGFTDEYKVVKMMMYRDSTFDIDQMHKQSRNGTQRRIASRGIAMTIITPSDIICHVCQEPEYIKADCPKEKKTKGVRPDRRRLRKMVLYAPHCYSQATTIATRRGTRPSKSFSA